MVQEYFWLRPCLATRARSHMCGVGTWLTAGTDSFVQSSSCSRERCDLYPFGPHNPEKNKDKQKEMQQQKMFLEQRKFEPSASSAESREAIGRVHSRLQEAAVKRTAV